MKAGPTRKVEGSIPSLSVMSVKGAWVDGKGCECGCWNKQQHDWHALVDKMGEKDARAFIAARLRKAADLIESKRYPDIFGCEMWENSLFEVTTITLSQPWPG